MAALTLLAPLPRLLQTPPRLELVALRAGAELPDILPGALPRLQLVDIRLEHQLSAAPASWGAPDALPSLEHLTLHIVFTAPLPPQWSAGFRGLRTLALMRADPGLVMYGQTVTPPLPAGEAEALARAPRLQTPPEWGDGFPRLRVLRISAGWSHLGGIPTRVEDLVPASGFAALVDM